MQIGKMIAAHQQFAERTARLNHAKSTVQPPFVSLDFMRKGAAQVLARVIEALLRIPCAIEQLAPQRTRAAIELPLQIYDIRHNQFGRSARGRSAKVRDEIGN